MYFKYRIADACTSMRIKKATLENISIDTSDFVTIISTR